MHPDEAYESWKRARARAGVPPGFAATVTARVRAGPAPGRRPGPRAWLHTALASRPARVAACLLAAAACAFRAAQVLALFLPG